MATREKKARDVSVIAKAYIIPAPVRDVIVPFVVLGEDREQKEEAAADDGKATFF